MKLTKLQHAKELLLNELQHKVEQSIFEIETHSHMDQVYWHECREKETRALIDLLQNYHYE